MAKIVEKNSNRLPEKDGQFIVTSQIQLGKDGASSLFVEAANQLLEHRARAVVSSAGSLTRPSAALTGKGEILASGFRKRMGNASYADFETGSVSWKKGKDTHYLNTARLVRDHPNLRETYTTTRKGPRRFLINT